MKAHAKRTIGISATILSAIVFGSMPLFVKTIIAGGGTTYTVIFLRFLLSLPFLFLYLKWKKIPLSVTREELKHIVIITIFGYAITPLLLYLAYNYIPSGMATTIHFCYPAFTILGCIIFLKEKPHLMKMVSVGLCMLGIILFYSGDGGSANSLVGLILAFISGITYSFYVIYLDVSNLKNMPSFKLVFYMHSIGVVLMLILTHLTDTLSLALTPLAWGTAFVLALSVCFIGVPGFQIGVKYVGPTSTTILSTFEPITSLIVGVLLYNETMDLRGIIGCISIFAATAIIAKLKE